jgi:DNA-binding transcriptional LysR family regulator
VAQSEVELSLLPLEVKAPGLHLQPLYEEKVAFVVRRDHPVIRGTVLTRRHFETLNHVEVHVLKGGGVGSLALERVLKERGLTRQVSLVLPHFLPAALTAVTTDAIARLPLRFAREVGALLPIKILRPPFPAPGYLIGLGWHERTHRDPAVRHLRELIIEVLREPRR